MLLSNNINKFAITLSHHTQTFLPNYYLVRIISVKCYVKIHKNYVKNLQNVFSFIVLLSSLFPTDLPYKHQYTVYENINIRGRIKGRLDGHLCDDGNLLIIHTYV